MTWKKYLITFTAVTALIIISFAAFLLSYSNDSLPVVAKGDNTENEASNSSNGDSNISNNVVNNIDGENVNVENSVTNETSGSTSDIDNNIENDINAEDADVSNSISNDGSFGDNSQINNNVINNFNVSIDVNVTNNIENNAQQDDGAREETSDDNGDSNGKDNGNDKDTNGSNDEPRNGDEESEIIWGVDSASLTDQEMLDCVYDNFGEPQVWGRYLGDKEGVSYGLTAEEVDLLHSNDIQILVIWNHFTNGTGYEKGHQEATEAIELAEEFGIPEGVAIFANVEPEYPIDSAFIQGWYDALADSIYEVGIYGIFDPEEELYVAYEAAMEENEDIRDNMYVWTASPYEGITTEENAPESFEPDAPEGALAKGWQYGIEADACNIDTNLFKSDILDVLW